MLKNLNSHVLRCICIATSNTMLIFAAKKHATKGKSQVLTVKYHRIMLTCSCPLSTPLAEICPVTCTENFGQIQKIAFQRLTSEGVRNGFTTTDIKKLASWQSFFTATGDTKITVSPFINAPTSDGGGARTFGGGNETLGGVEEVAGSEPVTFNAQLRGIPQSIIKVLKSYMCDAKVNNLGVYLINENGQIEAIDGGEGATPSQHNYYPIPVKAFFVGDKIHGGLEAPDSNAISWSFAPNYSDDLVVITPEFNATELESGC